MNQKEEHYTSNYKKSNKRISLHIATRNRPSELALLLQSLRTQSIQNWDLVICDESQKPMQTNFIIDRILNQIRIENHYVHIFHNSDRFGICNARNLLIEKDYFNNQLICRLDDDVIIENNYLELLYNVIKEGYDIASGITPALGIPTQKRKIKTVLPTINKKEFDEENNLIKQNDDCGYDYLEKCQEVIPTHEFRSCAMMRKQVTDAIKYPDNLSKIGFREEGFFSTKAIQYGFKIGININAKALHFQSPLVK